VIQKNQSRVSFAFMMTLPVRPASGILYMEIWGRGVIPLTRIDEKFLLHEK
jgi:hypothetical protein